MPSKFAMGDYAYFDDDKGLIRGIRPAEEGRVSFDVCVEWDNGAIGWVWESDLLTQAEYDEFNEPLED